jgi:hypothetical protein
LLDNLNLVDDDYLKRAAVLLFHLTSKKFIIGAYVKIGFFATTTIYAISMKMAVATGGAQLDLLPPHDEPKTKRRRPKLSWPPENIPAA